MAYEVMKLSLLFIIFVACLQATNETDNSTEFDMSCDDNNICSTFLPELENSTTDDFYSTEKYTNETINDTLVLHPKTNERQKNKLSSGNIDFCLCDLQVDYCDINCCCDKNCTYDQKLIFSDCESPPSYQDPNYCYTSKFLYENRTKIYLDVPEQRLFCILRSNLVPYHVIQLNKPIESLKSAEYFTSRRQKWPKSFQTAEPDKLKAENISPKYNNYIWLLVADAEVLPLMLPDKFTSNICVQKKPVRYLIDFISICTQILINEENTALNPETYYKNISILSLPKLSNSTLEDGSRYECAKNSCLTINVFLCDESLTLCENLQNDTNIKLICHFSTFRNERSCSFVPQKVRYIFFLNVNSELTNVNLYLFLSNITYFVNDPFEFAQYFEVKFLWEGYTQNFSSALSGNPGYILGKYILYGDLVTDKSNDTIVKYTVSQNESDITKNFLVFPKNDNGFCVFNNYMYLPVQFGYNLRTNCIYRHQINISENATSICVNLQKHIFHMWQINISRDYSESGKYVGMLGNSNRLKISEWTEILYKFNDGKILEQVLGEFKNERLICKNIAQLLSVNIIYAHVDFKFTAYQPKILNVFLETQLTEYFDTQYIFNESIRSNLVDVDLKTEIMFYDITRSKLKEYANPPNLQFYFPHDFFYPFMMGGQKKISCNFWLLLFCSCHIFIIKYCM